MIRLLAGSILLYLVNSAFAQQSVPSKVTFIVKDDAGQIVTNAHIRGGFLDLTNAGARDKFEGITDGDGLFIAEGQAVIGVGGAVTAEGHYGTRVNRSLQKQQAVELKRWNVDIPVLLKRIRNPIQLYTRNVEKYTLKKAMTGRNDNNKLNVVVRYDLVKGAIVQPFGTGTVADVEFTWNVSIVKTNDTGVTVNYERFDEVRISNVCDGIMKGEPDGSEDGQNGSMFISQYSAPVEGYTNGFSFYKIINGQRAESNDDRHYLYYIRIRTQTNVLGQITNALYGKIYGQINGNFTYFLNPTPNDRNIEEKRRDN